MSQDFMDNLPKLIFKKYSDPFIERDKAGKLTKEDIDDWIDGFERFIKLITSKEFKEFKQKKQKTC